MERLAVITILAATAQVILSAPTLPQILVVEPSGGGPQCVRFNSPVCNALGGQGYSYASFPNPLAPAYLPNPRTAENEANAVIQQALTSRCSQYVAEFMCFAYFPLCDQNSMKTPPVLPCKSLCERVRSDCEPVLNATYGIRWPQWANCENIASAIAQNHAENVCFGTPAEVAPTQATTLPATAAQRETAPRQALCGGICNQVQATADGLQLRNYTFVAKVKVQSKTTADKAFGYVVEVLDYARLQECAAGTPQLPPKTVVISLMASDQCPPCFDLTPGMVYFVGGYSSSSKQDKGGVWSVPTQVDTVSPWENRYSQTWMQIKSTKSSSCQSNVIHA